jgi:hypothetical protein
MPYDLRALSWPDFEDLARDLIGRELGVRFEAFAPGPDGGMDSRHATAEGTTILQASTTLSRRPEPYSPACAASEPRSIASHPRVIYS